MIMMLIIELLLVIGYSNNNDVFAVNNNVGNDNYVVVNISDHYVFT